MKSLTVLVLAWAVLEGFGVDLLNPDGSRAPSFSLPGAVSEQHTSNPFRTVINFTLPTDQPIGDQEYYTGLIWIPLAIVVSLLLLGLTVCCSPLLAYCGARCCKPARTKEKSRKIGFGLYVVLNLALVASYIFLFTTANETIAAWDAMSIGLIGLLNTVVHFANTTAAWSDTTLAWSAAMKNLNDSCDVAGIPPQVRAEIQNYSIQSSGYLESVSNKLNVVSQGVLLSVEDDLKYIDSGGNQVSRVIATGFIIFNAVQCVIVLLFFVWVCFQFCRKEKPADESRKVNCCRSCVCSPFCGLMFFILSLILIITSIFSVVFQLTGQVGSDICSPSPDQVIQRIAAEVLGADELNTLGEPYCVPVSGSQPVNWTNPTQLANQATLSILCYYQTCAGRPTAISEGVAALESINQTITPSFINNIPDSQCKSLAVNLTDGIQRTAYSTLMDAIHTFSCSRVNRLYQLVAFDALCYGYIPAFVKVWKCLFSVCVLWTATLGALLFFHLSLPHNHDFSEHAKLPGSESTAQEPMLYAETISGLTQAPPASDSGTSIVQA